MLAMLTSYRAMIHAAASVSSFIMVSGDLRFNWSSRNAFVYSSLALGNNLASP